MTRVRMDDVDLFTSGEPANTPRRRDVPLAPQRQSNKTLPKIGSYALRERRAHPPNRQHLVPTLDEPAQQIHHLLFPTAPPALFVNM